MSVNVIKTIVNVATSSTFTLFSRTVFCKTTCTQTLKCKMTLTLIGLSIELMVRISKWFLSYVTCNWMFPCVSNKLLYNTFISSWYLWTTFKDSQWYQDMIIFYYSKKYDSFWHMSYNFYMTEYTNYYNF